jgi:hypothetical protein
MKMVGYGTLIFYSISFSRVFLADGCDLMSKEIGLEILLDVCRYSCETNEKEGGQLRMMTLGALHNIINSNGNTRQKCRLRHFHYSFLEKVAESISKENLFKTFHSYIPFISESKILLFLFSICSNMLEHDTSKFFVIFRILKRIRLHICIAFIMPLSRM